MKNNQNHTNTGSIIQGPLCFLKSNKIIFVIGLSWFYAACSQVILPLPFNMVPISLQPLPLLVCTEFFGWTAVHAYLLYLMQGALGAPFFSRFGHGLVHLLGPTGGYLWGFLLAMIFMVVTQTMRNNSRLTLVVCYWTCNFIIFFCGLMQLAWFVAPSKLLSFGLYPFILGDFLIKPLLFILAHRRYNNMQK